MSSAKGAEGGGMRGGVVRGKFYLFDMAIVHFGGFWGVVT
jgi:hypothetical protein